jgi:Zn-dependent M28 family amino/carboxypeptidase
MKYGMPLIKRGAIAIIIVADDVAEKAWDDANENFKRGSYDIEGGPNTSVNTKVPVLWVHKNAKNIFENGGLNIEANLIVEKYPYPSVNIIGKIAGTDPTLKSEYLLYSGHQDAHGIRNSINNDSTYYGADDNGSVDVAMLANAENINYPKLKKMADWMYRTGYKVANAINRPATDKGFKLER